MWPILRILIVLFAVATVPFLHHGHIAMFITDVRQRVEKSGDRRMRDARIEQESSKLRLSFGHSATRYEVSVHRKTRSVDVALNLEGSPADNERTQDALVAAADEIRATLGRDIELERLPTHRARLVRKLKLSDADWSPKRDLTPAVVADTSDLLVCFIRTLDPIVRRRRASDRRTPPEARA
jgi:hypothetical protein